MRMSNASSHHHIHHGAEGCKCKERDAYGVAESLDELEFKRSLGRAAFSGDLDRVTVLLSKGSDPNAEDSSGYVPLHYAARNGHSHIVSLLIKNGALVNKKTRAGQATSLHRAAYCGHKKVVEILLTAGADPCIQDADGCTALHKAVLQGHDDVANLLISANTKVSDIRDNKGYLPGEK